MTADSAIVLVRSVIGVGLVIGALEAFVRAADYGPGTLLYWRAFATPGVGALRWARLSNVGNFFVASHHRMRVVAVLRLVAAVVVLSGVGGRWAIVAAALITLLLNLAIHSSLSHGHDGADQMTVIVLLSVSIYGIFSDAVIGGMCLGFIAAESCLAYMVSGAAKLISSGWRTGTYLPAILSTQQYGHKPFGMMLRKYAVVARALSVGTIVFECLFPVALFAPREGCYAFFVCGVLFHASVALFMGLNNFVWAFVATYPAVLYVHDWIGWCE